MYWPLGRAHFWESYSRGANVLFQGYWALLTIPLCHEANFCSLALNGGEWSASRSAYFIRMKSIPVHIGWKQCWEKRLVLMCWWRENPVNLLMLRIEPGSDDKFIIYTFPMWNSAFTAWLWRLAQKLRLLTQTLSVRWRLKRSEVISASSWLTLWT